MDASGIINQTAVKAGSAFGSLLGAGVAIFFVVIGVIHKDDCTGAPYLGVSLIVLGTLNIVTIAIQLCACIFGRGRGYEEISPEPAGVGEKCLRGLNGLVGLTSLGFFIYLCIMVYGLNGYVNYEDHANQYYCDKVLYLSAFWILTISLSLLGLGIVLLCLIAVCAGVAAAANN